MIQIWQVPSECSPSNLVVLGLSDKQSAVIFWILWWNNASISFRSTCINYCDQFEKGSLWKKRGARVMHTAMAHLRSCRWFKLKPISRTREVAYFCQGEYIRRIIVARNQIEVARHEKWIMNSTLRTPHTYIHNMPCLPGTWCGLLVLSNSKEDDFFHVWTQGRIFQGSLPRSKVKMIVKLQTQKKVNLTFMSR